MNLLVDWSRTPEHPDVITIATTKLAPNQETLLQLTYSLKSLVISSQNMATIVTEISTLKLVLTPLVMKIISL
jgi:hypothetical protein